MRDRLNASLPVEMIARINELATQKRLTRSAIVEAAITGMLSPVSPDQHEAAFARWLDRLSRQMQRLERNTGLSIEALALFVRFWLTVTPPLPPEAQAAAQAKGRERFDGFIETLARRWNQGRNALDDILGEAPEPQPHEQGDMMSNG